MQQERTESSRERRIAQYKSYEQQQEEDQCKPLLFQSPAPATPDPLFYAQLSSACGSH